jgi:putative tricarboxylic transport membrane protein
MKADRVGGIGFFALGILYVYQGGRLPPGAEGALGSGFFPILIGICLMLLSIPLLIRPKDSKMMKDVIPKGGEGRRVLQTILVFMLSVLLLKPLGFLLTTFLLFLTLLQLYERGRWPAAIVLSLAAVLGSYWLFVKLFDLVLPQGLLSL